MASRAVRARPLDVNRPLELIADLELLDSTEGLPARDVVHNHAALDAENEKVRGAWRPLRGAQTPDDCLGNSLSAAGCALGRPGAPFEAISAA